ncbi:DMT family transporter [Alloalcanivorax mobilis]|uniref:DMT family transporter n=1 Tax=Alloalcanivorax mobilis TaxID=2019569 RepID=UPI000C76241F|nr:DMT family transporter [Alloalcanivorax mobilis]
MNYLFPLGAVLIFAGNNVVNRLAVGVLHPAEIGFYRWLLAGLLLTPFMVGSLRRHWGEVRPHLGRIVVLGLLGMAVYQSLAYYAATLTTATNMGIILSLMPMMALGLSIAVLGTPLTRGASVGALVSLAGVLLVVSGGDPAALLHQGVNGGDGMMIVATFAYAVYGVLLKRWRPPVPPLLLLYLQVLVAIVFLLPLLLISPKQGASLAALPLVLYAGLLASMVAPLLWMASIARLGPGRTSLFFNLLPVLTALIAAWLLGERLTGALFLGGSLILAGVLIAELWTRPWRQ